MLHKHFSKHFEAKPVPTADAIHDLALEHVIPQVDIKIDTSEPTREEVAKAMGGLKTG